MDFRKTLCRIAIICYVHILSHCVRSQFVLNVLYFLKLVRSEMCNTHCINSILACKKKIPITVAPSEHFLKITSYKLFISVGLAPHTHYTAADELPQIVVATWEILKFLICNPTTEFLKFELFVINTIGFRINIELQQFLE